MNLQDIIFLFSPENEDKPTKRERNEKSKRRKESLFLECPQMREIAYKGFKFHEGVLELNKNYSKTLDDTTLKNAKEELSNFISILKNKSISYAAKATTIIEFNPENYTNVISHLNITFSKSLSRLNNIKRISEAFLSCKISLSKYIYDLENQISFFEDLLKRYDTLSIDNAFAIILRYDVKTQKKNKRTA